MRADPLRGFEPSEIVRFGLTIRRAPEMIAPARASSLKFISLNGEYAR